MILCQTATAQNAFMNWQVNLNNWSTKRTGKVSFSQGQMAGWWATERLKQQRLLIGLLVANHRLVSGL